MKEKESSRYQDAVLLKRPRKALASFLDILILFIFSVVLFSASDAILSVMPSYKTIQNEAGKRQENLYDIVAASKLSEYDGGRLSTPEACAEKYLKASVLATLMEVKPEAEISKKIYDGVEPITEETDGLFYYFTEFKTTNNLLFNEESRNNTGIEYYHREILGEKDLLYFDCSEDYPRLTASSALAIDQYYLSASAEGEKIYEDVIKLYSDGNRKARADLEENYLPYLSEYDAFVSCRDSLLEMRGIAILVSYVVSVLLVYLLFPLLFHDGKTISYRILDIGVTDLEGRVPGIGNHLLRNVFALLENMFLPFFLALLFFGGEGIYFMDINILGFFNLFVGMVFGIVFLVLSSLFDLWTRKGVHQTLVELLSLIVVRDGKEFKAREGVYERG